MSNQKAEALQRIRDAVANDAAAITHTSLGSYRTALLAMLDGEISAIHPTHEDHAALAPPPARSEAEMLEALEDLIELCYRGDFKNGNTDSTGAIDEGDHWAGVIIDRARAAALRAKGKADD